jgi:hypothetical protein
MIMIDVKQAIIAAKDALRNYYGDLEEVRLEEVVKKKRKWYITLGFNQGIRETLTFLKPEPLRAYKKFKISGSGEVLRMEIR